jgi:hypothetical protein
MENLKKAVEKIIEKGRKENAHFLEDIIKHGIESGIIGELVYYADTSKFYREYEDDIWELLSDMTDELGYDNVFSFLSTLKSASTVSTSSQFEGLLVWLAVEEIARQMLDKNM